MPIDIRLDHLSIVQNILKMFVPSCRVLAFGSRVKGTAQDTSDLDLCIIDNKPVAISVLSDLRDTFSQSDLPYMVDVIDWTSLTPDFQKLILENCFDIQATSIST